jgi:regulator of replication initiation timing
LSVVVITVCCTDGKNQVVLSDETATAQNESYALTDPYAKISSLTTQLTESLAKLDAMLAQYQQENTRLEGENQGYREQLQDFWKLMNEQYDFEGHNELYRRSH